MEDTCSSIKGPRRVFPRVIAYRGQGNKDPPEVAGCVRAQSILQGFVIV